MSTRTALWLVVLLTAGCFREPARSLEAADAPPTALQVLDPGGASFPLLDTPRDPRLVLAFEHGTPADAEAALLFVRGVFDGALLTRLHGARSGSSLGTRSMPLALEPAAHSLTVRPPTLRTGVRYSLAWLTDAGALAYVLTVSRSPLAGAQLVESWPSRGESRVPAQLQRALLRFDGLVLGELASLITLRDASGERVPTRLARERCTERGLADGDCIWLTPEHVLTAGMRHRLSLAPGLVASNGAPIAPVELEFDVEPESAQAGWVAVRCASDEQALSGVCLRVDERSLFVRGAVSAPALLTLASADDSGVGSTAALSYANTFALQLSPAAQAGSALLRLTDLAGRSQELALSFALAAELPRIAIDELRADPLGKEPAQEYVELVNYGDSAISLQGFSLTRDVLERGRSVLAEAELAPGERALLVGPDFDPRDSTDGPLPGVRLLSLDGALGLGNSGQSVFLRDGTGRRLAAAQSLPALLEGQCTARYAPVGQVTDSARSDAAELFELDPSGSCTPGRATFARP